MSKAIVNASGIYGDNLPARVIDGKNETNFTHCNCCFASNKSETIEWLHIDLRATYTVGQIHIFGRTDGNVMMAWLYFCFNITKPLLSN